MTLTSNPKKVFITLSQEQKPQLYHEGHYYYRIASTNLQDKRIWRCIFVKYHESRYTFTETVGDNCDVWILNEDHLEAVDPTRIINLEHRRK